MVRPGKRFSANFFVTVLEGADKLTCSSSCDIPTLALSADGTEILSLRVAAADDFIHATLRNQNVLYPPQFCILSDLAKTTRQGLTLKDQANLLVPLLFDSSSQPRAEGKVIVVEEEARNISGKNFAWDRAIPRPTGWFA